MVAPLHVWGADQKADQSVAELPPLPGLTQLRHEFLESDFQQPLRKYNDAKACYLVPKNCFFEPARRLFAVDDQVSAQ